MWFEDGKGINFEELIGVVYVSCFIMVFFFVFLDVGYNDGELNIIVRISLEKNDDGFEII